MYTRRPLYTPPTHRIRNISGGDTHISLSPPRPLYTNARTSEYLRSRHPHLTLTSHISHITHPPSLPCLPSLSHPSSPFTLTPTRHKSTVLKPSLPRLLGMLRILQRDEISDGRESGILTANGWLKLVGGMGEGGRDGDGDGVLEWEWEGKGGDGMVGRRLKRCF